ncbi:MAG TPA: Gfo/Idh/MocA family oxidoreductase [Verrucomicrobiae bacterium]|nr:Gfo/Idh/MocA family oxidoreductase [Verrucomicrobiae bacterium]
MKSHLSVRTRRNFITKTAILTGAAASAKWISAPAILSAASPNSQLGIAVIACGGMGGGNPEIAAKERLVALVDVDEKKLAEGVKKVEAKVPNPKTFFDYRKMYDECYKDIDVVLIATPDHHHAPAAMRGIQRGKHVFVQKPLAHNLYEVRALTEAARKHKVATQMGNQGHSEEGYRILCEYIWAGAIGNVTETHSLMQRSFGGTGGRPESKPVPPGLHWEEWLGPAPFREYHDGLHPSDWRSWVDFGTGTLGDMGCHLLDGAFWALKLSEAKKFSIECLQQVGGTPEKFPQDNILKWEFPSRGGMPPVKVFAHDNKWPDFITELAKQHEEKFTGGTLYVGDKGYMFSGTYGGKPRIIPKAKHDEFPIPPKTIPRSKHGVMGDFLAACKGEEPASSNFNVSGPFTEFVLTGTLASRAGVGKKIEWDVTKLKCTNLPEINQMVKRSYRKGWEI